MRFSQRLLLLHCPGCKAASQCSVLLCGSKGAHSTRFWFWQTFRYFADIRFVFEFGSLKYFDKRGRFDENLTGGFRGPSDRVVFVDDPTVWTLFLEECTKSCLICHDSSVIPCCLYVSLNNTNLNTVKQTVDFAGNGLGIIHYTERQDGRGKLCQHARWHGVCCDWGLIGNDPAGKNREIRCCVFGAMQLWVHSSSHEQPVFSILSI